jgi:hypothetical protein
MHAFGNRVAVNPQSCRGVGNPFLVSVVGFLNVELFKLFEGLVQQDVAVEHVFNYCFQAGAYLHFSFPIYLTYELFSESVGVTSSVAR